MLIFGSWCPGLESHPSALAALRSSSLLDGIETAHPIRTALPLQQAGVRVNLHNPTRWGVRYLSEERFVEKNFLEAPGFLEACAQAEGPVQGFHLPPFLPAGIEGERALERIVQNAAWLERALPEHCIALEFVPALTRATPYDIEGAEDLRLPPGATALTHLALIEVLRARLSAETSRVGFLIDCSHLLVGLEHTLRPRSEAALLEAFQELLALLGPTTWQIHVNAPAGSIREGMMDVHAPLSASGNGELARSALALALQHAPLAKALTLEMEIEASPAEHVEMLEREAHLLRPTLRTHRSRVAA